MKIQNRDFFELRGKVAFLPGGYGDLGRAIALDLAQRGAAVVVAGRNLEKGLALAEQIRAEVGEAWALALDAAAAAEIPQAADAVVERYGALDILVNCIGIQREQPILEVHCSREVQEVRSGVYLTGEIPRRTGFEGGMSGARMIKEGSDLVDPLLDEQALVVNLGEEGIVVVSGCSHPGIVNTIHRAREITDNDRLLAVVGGFHLAQVSDEVIAQTAAALKESKARLVASGHCNGSRPNARLSGELAHVFAINCVGTRVVLGGQ